MFEVIDNTTKSSDFRTTDVGRTTIVRNIKTVAAEANQKKPEKQKGEFQKIKDTKNISQKFLSELEKDIEVIHQVRINFSVHEETGRTMVKVINKDTGKTIREVPSERILDMAAKLDEITGMLSDATV